MAAVGGPRGAHPSAVGARTGGVPRLSDAIDGQAGAPSGDARREAKQVTPLELFFDLVFVFAVTQVSHLLLNDLTWVGALHALLALLVVWWAWNYTVWVTSEVDLEPIGVRLLFLGMMLASLAMAAAVPEAFDRDGLLFAAAYIAIKIGRLLFLTVGGAHAAATGPGRGSRLVTWFFMSGAIWLAGGAADGALRIGLWISALALDLAGPLVMYWIPGRPRLPFGLWHVELRHLAERFETFVIIALGETIVLTGATASLRGFDAERFVAFALAFVSTAALYWLYFDEFPAIAKRALELRDDGVHLIRDAYMYLHVVVVGGVILSAIGDGLVMARPSGVLPPAEVAVIAAGPALYLLGHVLFRLRIAGRVSWIRLGASVACVPIGLLGVELPALLLSSLLVIVLVVVVAGELASGHSAVRDNGGGANAEP